MSANYGGTNIYSPLEDVLVYKNKAAFKAGDEVILKVLTGMNIGYNGMTAKVDGLPSGGRYPVTISVGMKLNVLEINLKHANKSETS
jgi:hypothetical protein